MDIVARSTATAELTSVLAKRVQARGECVPNGKKPKVSAEDDKWFPVTRNEPDLEAQAREACSGWPVRVECAELALREEAALPSDWIQGIYGGLAPHQRIEAIQARRARSGEVAR